MQYIPAAAGIAAENHLEAATANGAVRLVAIFVVAIKCLHKVVLQNIIRTLFVNTVTPTEEESTTKCDFCIQPITSTLGANSVCN